MENTRRYDIIVAGGGLTGVAAAISGAREGCRVRLIEKSGFLGGAACNCLVHPFMPYHRARDGQPPEPVNAGLFTVILNRMAELGGLAPNRGAFREETMKLVLDRMCQENDVTVLLHTTLIGVSREGNRITSVETYGKSGRHQWQAEYFIDCTGDADLTYQAGCPTNLGRETDHQCQPMTLCFRMGNVDMEKWAKSSRDVNRLYREYQACGKIRNPREDVLVPQPFFPMKGVVHFNTTRVVGRSPVQEEDLSAAEREAREQVQEMVAFLQEAVDGFQDAQLLMCAPEIGVRESRMIQGEYLLTAEDLLNCVKFPDSVARGVYQIDIHSPDGSGTYLRQIPKGDYYTIPYRSLIPKGMENLLAAGRCLSSTHEAQSAYRVMPICCCIGEGAGTAAALAFKAGCRIQEVSYQAIHQQLDRYGAKY